MKEFCITRTFSDISPRELVKVCFGTKHDRKTSYFDSLNSTWGNKNVQLEEESSTSWVESFDTPLALSTVMHRVVGVDWTHMRQVTTIKEQQDGSFVLERKATISGVVFAEYYNISFAWKIFSNISDSPSISPSTCVELRGQCSFTKKYIFTSMMEKTLASECASAQTRLLDFTKIHLAEYSRLQKEQVVPLPSSPMDVGLKAASVTKRYQSKSANVAKRSDDGVTWENRWLVVQGVHMTYKNEVTDADYAGTINLTKCAISPVEESRLDETDYYFLSIRSEEVDKPCLFCLRFDTQIEAETWQKIIQQNVSLWRRLTEQKAKRAQKRDSSTLSSPTMMPETPFPTTPKTLSSPVPETPSPIMPETPSSPMVSYTPLVVKTSPVIANTSSPLMLDTASSPVPSTTSPVLKASYSPVMRIQEDPNTTILLPLTNSTVSTTADAHPRFLSRIFTPKKKCVHQS